MGFDERSPDFNAAKAELFEAISHPIRIKILQVLDGKPMGFAELGRAVGIESGGHLAFHLTKLRQLVRLNPQGNYELNDDGREALWSVNALERANDRIPKMPGQVSLKHKNWVKPALVVIVIVLLILGGVNVFQQQEYSSQQQELSSQQALIGALQVGIPFFDAQSASIVIGQPDFTSNSITTSQSGLYAPTQALFDASGNLWVTDTGNHRVVEFRPPFSDGMSASIAIGQDDFIDASPGTSQTNIGSQIPVSPTGEAFDHLGDLWVADYGNNRVIEFRPPFSTGMTASLVIGQKNFTTRFESYVGRNTLDRPSKVVFDSNGHLWVLDNGDNRVLEYAPPFTSGMNATVVIGQSSFHGSGISTMFNGLPILCSVVITRSCDLAIDPFNNVWVGDPENARILEFKPPYFTGMNASLVIGEQDLVTNPGTWSEGTGFALVVAFDSAGNLWTNQGSRLLVFKHPFVASARPFPSLEIGQPNFTSTTHVGGQNTFFDPSDPGFDSYGNLWVPDGNRILEFAALSAPNGLSSQVSVAAGTGQPPPTLLAVSILLMVPILGVVLLRRKSRQYTDQAGRGCSCSVLGWT